jgi:hypothetical protein
VTHARQQLIQVVAHRGASEDAPEHTLAAYRKAIEDGADALECDVRLTADGHLVCVHDRRVNRTSNGRGAVSALELSDLAALDFGSRRTREFWRTRDEEPDWVYRPEDQEDTSVLTLERLLELVADAGRRVEMAMGCLLGRSVGVMRTRRRRREGLVRSRYSSISGTICPFTRRTRMRDSASVERNRTSTSSAFCVWISVV